MGFISTAMKKKAVERELRMKEFITLDAFSAKEKETAVKVTEYFYRMASKRKSQYWQYADNIMRIGLHLQRGVILPAEIEPWLFCAEALEKSVDTIPALSDTDFPVNLRRTIAHFNALKKEYS